MKRSLITGTAILAVVMFVTPVAFCGTKEWDRGASTDNWADGNNWYPDGVPGPTDDVVFLAMTGAYTVDMNASTGYAQTITMHGNCTLNIQDQKTLEIGSANGQSSEINGSIALPYDESVLQIMYTHSISGSGAIDGEDDEATIQIGDDSDPNDTTLTSTTNIKGGLRIVRDSNSTGTMTFVNNGVVEANVADNPLTIQPDVVAGSGEWWVTATDAELNFVTGSTSLTGAFTMDADGTLDIDDHVETTASLTFSNGKIEVAPYKRFVANK
jgi:hypothetical protein